jgi:hypothetical protein
METPVEKLLHSLALGPHVDTFRINGIVTLHDVEILTREDIIELGVQKIGERNRLLDWITKRRSTGTSTTTTTDGPPPKAAAKSMGVVETTPPRRSGIVVVDDTKNLRLSPHNNNNSIIQIQVMPTEVSLTRAQDMTTKRMVLAEDIGRQIHSSLRNAIGSGGTRSVVSDNNATHFLRVRVTVVSEGSRDARLWGAGAGHSKLSLEWSLVDMHGTPYIPWQRFVKTDSGALGWKDLTSKTVGETSLYRMASEAANEITMRVNLFVQQQAYALGGAFGTSTGTGTALPIVYAPVHESRPSDHDLSAFADAAVQQAAYVKLLVKTATAVNSAALDLAALDLAVLQSSAELDVANLFDC